MLLNQQVIGAINTIRAQVEYGDLFQVDEHLELFRRKDSRFGHSKRTTIACIGLLALVTVAASRYSSCATFLNKSTLLLCPSYLAETSTMLSEAESGIGIEANWVFKGYETYNAQGPTCTGREWQAGDTTASNCLPNFGGYAVNGFDANGNGAFKICLYSTVN